MDKDDKKKKEGEATVMALGEEKDEATRVLNSKRKKKDSHPSFSSFFFNLNSIVSIFQNFNACIPIGNEADKL